MMDRWLLVFFYLEESSFYYFKKINKYVKFKWKNIYIYIYAEQNRTKQNVYVKQICLIK